MTPVPRQLATILKKKKNTHWQTASRTVPTTHLETAILWPE